MCFSFDLTPADEWLAGWNASHPVTERLLAGLLMIRAVALALTRFAEFNGFYREGKFVPGEGIHVGTAISLRRGGLVAPGLRDADKRPLVELMAAFRDLVARARSGRLKSSEMAEATRRTVEDVETQIDQAMSVSLSNLTDH